MNWMARRRKIHSLTCCVTHTSRSRDACALCGCSRTAGRHRQSDNKHYHAFVGRRVERAAGIARGAPIFAEIIQSGSA